MSTRTEDVPASVVLIGCPVGADLPAFTKRLVLVEPDLERAAGLEQAYADRSDISIVKAGLGAASGKAGLFHFNVDDVRSLRPPRNRLGTLVSGLTCRKHGFVDIMSPGDLVLEIGELPRPLHVHVNLLGLEEEILTAWPAPMPDSLVMQCSRLRILKGQADLSFVVQKAREQLFDVVALDDDNPDWLEIKLQRNKDRVDRSQAIERLSEVEGALAIQIQERKRAEEEKALALHAEKMLNYDLQNLRKRHKTLQLEQQKQVLLLQRLVSLLRIGADVAPVQVKDEQPAQSAESQTSELSENASGEKQSKEV